jgi:pimeloyl-ACP methyl ester carboxylesterase
MGPMATVEGATRVGRREFAGHGISYRVAGSGPALVVVKPHRLPRVYELVPLLCSRYTVIQIEPLGFGSSDRPADHPGADVHEQVLAVLEQQRVDRFIVWGYSLGGAMSLAVARASARVTACVVGGWSPTDGPSATRLQRMDRERRAPVASRAFWRSYARFDWLDELAAKRLPTLVYVGTDDRPRTRGPRGIPRTRQALAERGVTVVEFSGLDHRTCNAEPALSTRVVPSVMDWLDDSVHR